MNVMNVTIGGRNVSLNHLRNFGINYRSPSNLFGVSFGTIHGRYFRELLISWEDIFKIPSFHWNQDSYNRFHKK